jgi:O-antigen ligase
MGTVVGIYAVCQHITGYGIPQPWQDESARRVTAWLGYPNAVGLLLAPLVAVAVGAGLNTNAPKHRYAYWVAAAIMSVAVFFAHSEGGLIGIGAGLVAMGILFSRQTRQITLALVIAGAIVVAAVAPLRQYAVKTLTLNDCPVLYECSLSLRRAQWVETWAMLSHSRWMYGAGLGGYQQAIAPYHNHPGIEIYLYPHNIFLNFWSEAGLLGLVIFLAILVAFWYQVSQTLGTKHRSLAIAAAGAMVTLLVHGLVDVPYFKNDLSVLFWLIVLVPFLVQKIDAGAEKN